MAGATAAVAVTGASTLLLLGRLKLCNASRRTAKPVVCLNGHMNNRSSV